MKALVQRVSKAHVEVAGERLGEIGAGMVVFVCAEAGDDDDGARFLARKIAKLRIFRDVEGRMNLDLAQTPWPGRPGPRASPWRPTPASRA